MSKKVYGVVLKNKKSGIFQTWPEAQDFIKTYPSNAKYKGFNDDKAAQEYIDGILGQDASMIQDSGEQTQAIAYVDGSFNAKANQWGYGVVLYETGSPEMKLEFSGSGQAYAESRNVTGEVYGAMIAVQESIKRGMTSITIYHDYAGIADWITGAWETKTEMTQKYKAWMDVQSKKIQIKFHKVAGHTGVELNERCDQLAKQACGVI